MFRRDPESCSVGTRNITGDKENIQRNSWLVPSFLLVNLFVFIVAMGINNCPKNNLGFQGDCVATFLRRLTKMGALKWDNIVHKHEGWRLVTSIWLHAGIIHFLFNMCSLVFIGIRLEQQFGFLRIGMIYLLSGFGGSVLSSLFLRNSVSVGASGALFGLYGGMLSELVTNWTIYSNKAVALLTLLSFIIFNLAISIFPHVDNFVHIGGFVVGFLLGFILLRRPQDVWIEQQCLPCGIHLGSKYNVYQHVLFVFLILLIVGLSIALVMLFKGENGYDHCHWCHYLTCVPTSIWSCNDSDS
ncbi:RHOMBOID-like protein 3 isoform X2 [Cicer arietinum]|uniref:RHOMBOID-like protein 3 isoform X2 n=1 Tax=Cicer arietinum TaxID=3827 RepID=UPI00032A52CA